jgi:hypothetical protein
MDGMLLTLFASAAVYALTPVAGAMNGLISWGARKNLAGLNGLLSWQWLYVIEGVVTVALGFMVMLLLPGMPDAVAAKGNWLFRHEKERQLLLERQKAGAYELKINRTLPRSPEINCTIWLTVNAVLQATIPRMRNPIYISLLWLSRTPNSIWVRLWSELKA